MTLKELHTKLTAMMAINKSHENDKVCIVTNDGGMGGLATSEIKSVNSGIDWNHGQLLLVTEDKLLKSK